MRKLPLTWLLAIAVIAAVGFFVFTTGRDQPPPAGTPDADSGERDTTAEEVRAAASRMNELQTEIDDLDDAARRENLALRQEIQQKLDELGTAVQTAGQQPNQEVLRSVSDLSSRLAALEQQPQPTVDLPPDYAVGTEPLGDIIWVESLTATVIAGTTALGAVAPPPQPPPPEPRYTLPPASIIDATALTALVGRIPVDGRIETPWRFKLISSALNMTSRRHQIPDLAGVIWSGVAYGDYTLSCVSGTIDTVSYVFADGTVHNQRTPANPDDITAGIGWISDAYGNPCVPGEFHTNAPAVIRRLITAGTIEGIASGYAEAQTRRTTDEDGRRSATVTGDVDDYALATAASDAITEANQWLLRRLSDSFDAVYVPANSPVVIHIEQQVEFDHAAAGRRLDHQQQSRAHALRYDSLGSHD